MIHRIIQNGMDVDQVQPGTPIQLGTGGTGFWTANVRYLVTDIYGNVYEDIVVAVNFAQNAWYDWVAPVVEGKYIFYGNYDNDKTLFRTLKVSSGAIAPSHGSYTTPIDPIDKSPADGTQPADGSTKIFGIGVGTVLAIGIGLVALLLLSGRKGQK
jgi:hypothetical protein